MRLGRPTDIAEGFAWGVGFGGILLGLLILCGVLP